VRWAFCISYFVRFLFWAFDFVAKTFYFCNLLVLIYYLRTFVFHNLLNIVLHNHFTIRHYVYTQSFSLSHCCSHISDILFVTVYSNSSLIPCIKNKVSLPALALRANSWQWQEAPIAHLFDKNALRKANLRL